VAVPPTPPGEVPAADPAGLSEADRGLLRAGVHPDPHRLFGARPADGGTVFRALKPAATHVAVRTATEVFALDDHGDGVFAAWAPVPVPDDYRLVVTYPGARTFVVADGYRMPPTVGADDLAALAAGTHHRLWEVLGARPMRLGTPTGAVAGTAFSVWAPRAAGVAVVGDFDGWTGFSAPMRRLAGGVWEVFVPEVGPGELYKFRIRTADDPAGFRDRADPMARAAELPPKTASKIADPGHRFRDRRRRAARDRAAGRPAPISVLEVHLGSWRIPGDYRRAAVELVGYAAELGVTHLELLPVAEHPYGGSWGYQITSYYAPTARYGDPDGLTALVDACHDAGLGVIVDWVPAHFPRDGYALARFDGEPLYEPADPLLADHPDWGTLTFDYDRPEVRAFLISNALYWLEEFGVDGLRIDAVASMLYRDYSRAPGAWSPNRWGGRENLAAISLLAEITAAIDRARPGALVIAEDSSDRPGLTAPRTAGGSGFTHSWDLGWMHAVTAWFGADDPAAAGVAEAARTRLARAHRETRVLALGHDEVVHGKGTPVTRMPGPREVQLAGFRALLGLMFAWPGAKLLFMGQEYGQTGEWSEFFGLDWKQLRDPAHLRILALVSTLNRLYRRTAVLWAFDADPRSVRWLDAADPAVVLLLRRAVPDDLGPRPAPGDDAGAGDGDDPEIEALLCVTNFAFTARTVVLPEPPVGADRWTVLLDTADYGPPEVGAARPVRIPGGHAVDVPARSTVWLAPRPAGGAAHTPTRRTP